MGHISCLIALSTTLTACALFPSSEPLGKNLSPEPQAPKEDMKALCRWVRSPMEPDLLGACRPREPVFLSQAEVSGLEELPAPLRECVLEGLPSLRTDGADSAECAQGVGRVLEFRLARLGWVDSEALPAAASEAGAPSAPLLAVRLSQRYRLGRIFVARSPDSTVSQERVIQEARRVIDKNPWATQANLEEIRVRIARLGKFQRVRVNRGAHDRHEPEKGVPVAIDIHE